MKAVQFDHRGFAIDVRRWLLLYTHRELAEKSGVSHSTIHRLLNQSIRDIGSLASIAQACELDLTSYLSSSGTRRRDYILV